MILYFLLSFCRYFQLDLEFITYASVLVHGHNILVFFCCFLIFFFFTEGLPRLYCIFCIYYLVMFVVYSFDKTAVISISTAYFFSDSLEDSCSTKISKFGSSIVKSEIEAMHKM